MPCETMTMPQPGQQKSEQQQPEQKPEQKPMIWADVRLLSERF
jgi:hypothetical protein